MQQIQVHHSAYNIPEAEEITFDQFIRLQVAKTDHKKIEVFTNAPLPVIPATPKVEKQMANLLAAISRLEAGVLFILNQPKQEAPFECQIRDKTVKIDGELGMLPYWAMVKCKEAMAETNTEISVVYNHYASLVGHFTYCLVSGKKYNEYKAEDYVAGVIRKLPFKLVIQIGDFYLQRAILYVNAERQLLDAEIPSNGEPDKNDLFGSFGELNILDALSDGNVLLWEDIKGLPFEVVLMKRRIKLSQALYQVQVDEFHKRKRQAS